MVADLAIEARLVASVIEDGITRILAPAEAGTA